MARHAVSRNAVVRSTRNPVSEFDEALEGLTKKGVSVSFSTLNGRPGWLCQLDAVKDLKFTVAEGKDLEESFFLASEKLDRVWASA